MVWDAWGAPEGRKELSPAIRSLLGQALGIDATPAPSRQIADVRLRDSTIDDTQCAALAAVVGAEHVRTEHDARVLHAGGKSTFDLLRRRADGPQEAPDAVVAPADHDEALAVLRVCSEQRIAVVPFGGGTSVVGGLTPLRADFPAVIALDLRRLDQLLALDTDSRTATFGAGVTGPRAEELLAAHGFSLGHFPQSFQFASLGGFAATRSSGQASAGYGRFDDMVQRLRVATPSGALELGRAPASAAGPDLRELFVGSEGAFGVLTEVTVRVHPVPEHVGYQAWTFPDFAAGAKALRTIAQSDWRPTVLRLSDEAETGINLAMSDDIGGRAQTPGCLAVTTFEGPAAQVAARQAAVAELCIAAGGSALGERAAQQWEHGRFNAPYLRDALLDVGVLCETLETAATWAALAQVRAAVTGALTESLAAQGTPALVLCHISHTYPAGASLYFTVVAKQADDAITQWQRAKVAASQAMIDAGATITHHHAVGTDHLPWMRAEVGDLGVEILRAVKSVVDPHGVLNPGKLVP